MTIPANAVIYSDPVNLAVPPMSDLAIDLYLPGTTNTPSTLTMHGGAFQTSYISETGNHVGKPTMPEVGTTRSWFLLSRVDVVAPDATGAVVAFGDSITDGAAIDAGHEQPMARSPGETAAVAGDQDGRAERGHRRQSRVERSGRARGSRHAAVGAGINALARFERHVLSLPG